MKRMMMAAALLLGSFTTAAAAVPDPESQQGDLACVALLDLAAAGVKASDKPAPQVVAATEAARWYYQGRASKGATAGTWREAKQLVDAMAVEEKTAVVNACTKRMSATLGEFLK